jgi:DNA-binding protein HU-beta
MTKSELVAKVTEKTSLKKAEAEKVVDALVSTLAEAIAKGERIAIPSLGVFNVKQRKEKKGRDPKTGKEIKIPARKVVVFTTAKSLKEAVNK